MDEIDKATTIIPDSPAQELLKKVNRRDVVVRTIELIALFFLVVFNMFIAYQPYNTQETIQKNQAINIERIQGRNADLQQYLTCVLTLPLSARSDEALKKCETTSTAFPPADNN